MSTSFDEYTLLAINPTNTNVDDDILQYFKMVGVEYIKIDGGSVVHYSIRLRITFCINHQLNGFYVNLILIFFKKYLN